MITMRCESKNLVAQLFILILIVSCAGTQSRLNELSLGMSKGDVISILGDPDSVAANSGAEYLVYNLSGKTGAGKAVGCSAVTLMTFGMGAATCSPDKEDFFVRLVRGAVDAYGKVGDFDSTKTPESTININTD
jgi:hypothetical protein